jgi:hypothetical protein
MVTSIISSPCTTTVRNFRSTKDVQLTEIQTKKSFFHELSVLSYCLWLSISIILVFS